LGDKRVDVGKEGRRVVVIEEIQVETILAEEKEGVAVVGRLVVEERAS
jgi:hypothetical protein